MDAEVQYTPDILKIIKKQDWMGFDTNKRPLFVNELKGLAPFSMVDLTEDEIADLMAADNVLSGLDVKQDACSKYQSLPSCSRGW